MNLLLLQLASIRGGSLTPVFGLLIDTALKGSLLIGAAAIVAHLLKDRSAAARHAAWTAAVIGHLTLPILTLMMPQWRLPLLPAPPWLDAAPVVSVQVATPELTDPPSAASVSKIDIPVTPQVAGQAPTISAPTNRTTPQLPTGPSNWPFISSLGLLWILGSTLVLLRLAVGTWKVGRLAKHGDRVDDGEWLSLTQRLANRLGITRPLTLLRGDSLAVPVTWGVVYPAVLLPPDSEEWPEARRRFVLVHEMAHVKRFDALTQLIAQMTVAILWFDPFIWYAAHRMRVEREHACDDYVLRDGTMPSLYAGELLEMVQSIGSAGHDRAAPAFAALAMARRSEFEGRMLAILDPRQNRHTLGRASALVASIALAFLVFPLAALRPFHQPGVVQPQGHEASKPVAAVTNSSTRNIPDNACDTARSTNLLHLHTDDDELGRTVELLKSEGSNCSQAAIVGRAVFANDRLISLPAGAYAVVREKSKDLDRSVRVTPRDDGTLEFTATLNGASHAYDDRMQQWFKQFLPEVLMEGGVDVPQRVARDMATGGVARVLSRIEHITSTLARRKHYEALLDGQPLTKAEYKLVADHAAKDLSGSASDLNAVLTRIAAGPAKGTKSVEEAVGYIGQAQSAASTALSHQLDTSRSKGDSVHALTQYAVTDDPEMMLLALKGAKDISSDTDKRTLLETVAAGSLRRRNAALRDAYFAVISTMQSDTDIRAVLIAALPYAHIDSEISFAVFKEVQKHMTDDTDKRAVLTTALEQHLLTSSQLRAAFMDAARTITSSTDYTAVMKSAFKQLPH